MNLAYCYEPTHCIPFTHLADKKCYAFGVALPDGGEDHADAVLVLSLEVCTLHKDKII